MLYWFYINKSVWVNIIGFYLILELKLCVLNEKKWINIKIVIMVVKKKLIERKLKYKKGYYYFEFWFVLILRLLE